ELALALADRARVRGAAGRRPLPAAAGRGSATATAAARGEREAEGPDHRDSPHLHGASFSWISCSGCQVRRTRSPRAGTVVPPDPLRSSTESAVPSSSVTTQRVVAPV